MSKQKFIVWFSEVGKEDLALVGGKGANLGEMTKLGLSIPPGFIVTTEAFFTFLEENKLPVKIKEILTDLDVNDPVALNRASARIKKEIIYGKISSEIAREILRYYGQLGNRLSFSQPLVAIRSSATAEDLPTASFAGQQVTFLNVKGEANVVEKVRQCWASLFEPRAIFYRKEHALPHFKIGIAVPIQKMVQAETSGVMFTIDPVTNDKKKIVIEAIWGLGELIVQGQITPDHYEIEKKSLEILTKEILRQTKMLVKKGGKNIEVRVPKKLQRKQKLTDKQIAEIAELGKKIEKHYYYPQDIEWAIEKRKIYIVQTRPVTTINEKLKMKNEKLEEIKRTVILKGQPASPGMATGSVIIIKSAKEIHKVKAGDVLVASQTNPDFVPAMKKTVAIITDKGGRTSHAAIVSRELGIPCIVGTQNGTKILKMGLVVTVNGATGEVFKGGIGSSTREIFKRSDQTFPLSEVTKDLKTATKLYVNLAEPELAEELAKKNVDGVGLLRAEFMIARIGIHPKKIIHDRKQKLFVDKLSSYLRTFCEHFNPRPVVYRATDLKTNEYRNLVGGKDYEPEEANPLLGYRGCFRYFSDPQVFELELEAIKKVRNKYGLRNLWLMIPFARTVEELRKVKKIIAAAGLIRSPSFKLWLMVEVPSNVILLPKFIEIGIDGVSLGSNDLTMLLLGIDRDNSELASEFDERDEAVIWALEKVVKTCQKYGITSSICGQAPSVYPEITEKLVEWGITSVSVSGDAIEKTRELIYETEKRLVKHA